MQFYSITFVILCTYFTNVCDTFNILAVYPLPLRSHYRFAEPLLLRLASIGHNVTIYSPYPQKRESVTENLHEIDTSECMKLPTGTFDFEALSQMEISILLIIWRLSQTLFNIQNVRACSPLMDLIEEDNSAHGNTAKTIKYDLLITEVFTEAFPLILSHKFDIPVVATLPNTQPTWIQTQNGSPGNPSYIKNVLMSTDPPLAFFQRLYNTVVYVFSCFVYYSYVWESDNKIIQNLTSNMGPNIKDLSQNVSIFLINSHESIHQSVPLPANVISVGGMHVPSKKQLPKEIDNFISESTHGVIYFCMGSLLKGASFPAEKRDAFLKAFSKIPQRILWKWEGDMPEKTDNIKTLPWMPQRDILGMFFWNGINNYNQGNIYT